MTTNLYIRICKYLRSKIAGTRWEGHVFAVGGCCRDMALGQEIKDIDLAVDLPDGGVEFANWLHSSKLATHRPVIFARYGTAMLRLRAFPHDEVEIVQTRAEKYTDKNSRNPETAHGSIYDDCMRRDLTINALYYDISRQKMLDVCGRSMHDIKHKIIATPCDADSTYDDDPIRILRTIRFATRLGWTIPEEINQAMARNAHRLTIIKPERLRGELEKLISLPRAGAAIDALARCGVFKVIMPELNSYFEKTDSTGEWRHLTDTLSLLPTDDIALRWAALISELKRPEKVLYSLKYQGAIVKDILYLCAHSHIALQWGRHAECMEDASLRRLQFLSGKPQKLERLFTLIHAQNNARAPQGVQDEQCRYIMERDAEMQTEGSAMYTYHLPFAERRIKKLLHIPPGPLVEDTLEYMMQLAYQNPRRSRSEFEALVRKYTPKGIDAQGLEALNNAVKSSQRDNESKSNQGIESGTLQAASKHKNKRGRNYHHRRRRRNGEKKQGASE